MRNLKRMDRWQLLKSLRRAKRPPKELYDDEQYHTLLDGYEMTYQRKEKHRRVFLEDWYKKWQCQKVPKAAVARWRAIMVVELEPAARRVPIEALSRDKRTVTVGLDFHHNVRLILDVRFEPNAGMMRCAYAPKRLRSRHDYAQTAEKFGWLLLEDEVNVNAAQVAAIYQYLAERNLLEFEGY